MEDSSHGDVREIETVSRLSHVGGVDKSFRINQIASGSNMAFESRSRGLGPTANPCKCRVKAMHRQKTFIDPNGGDRRSLAKSMHKQKS
jgi:hypothetical protein